MITRQWEKSQEARGRRRSRSHQTMILANLLVRQRRKAGFEKRAKLAELKNFPLTPLTNNEAQF